MSILSNPATPKEEIPSSTMETSISTTIDSIQLAIQQLDAAGNISVFLSKDVVARPPFAYFYGFVKFFAREKPSLGWDMLLLDDEMKIPQSKKEKLIFLARLLAVVSRITHYRHDIYVSPTNILCGQDVLSTHRFLKALADSTLVRHDEMAEALKNALDHSDASSYKTAVRTRAGFRCLQAVLRGSRVRKQYNTTSTARVRDNSAESDQHYEQMRRAIDKESDDQGTSNTSPNEPRYKTTSRSETEDLLESYQDVLFRKSKVEDELKVAEERLKVENDRLARILNIRSTHKKESLKPLPINPLLQTRPPFSAPSYSIVDRIANAPNNIEAPPVDEVFIDKITKLSIVERNTKKKAKAIEERERVLKQRIARSKQKESELRVQEQRISDIADKIRRQQLQLKEQKMQFEQSKLTDIVTSPSDTSRPCALCSEKEMHLRDVKDTVKQRMRLLKKREAEVIGRAQELRRREIKLMKLQHNIVDSQHTINCADTSSLGCEPQANNQTDADDKSRKEGDTNKLLGKISKRKRRRRNSREGHKEKTQLAPISCDTVEPSLIQSSCGMSVTTIAEEPSSLDEDGNTTESDSCIEDHSSEKIADVASGTCEAKKIASIAEKEMNKEAKNARTSRTDPTPKENVRKDRSILVDKRTSSRNLRLTKSGASSSKRHIFTFEKNGYEEKNSRKNITQSLLSAINDNDTESQHFAGRGSRNNMHDSGDWISSFDVQMKFAKSRLNELL
eukprot:CCRYP_007207-RA/>CCRYP_007207-RA protein AED:0.17 eAED:0.19 QI:0/0/0/0.5/1/1/2/0/734